MSKSGDYDLGELMWGQWAIYLKLSILKSCSNLEIQDGHHRNMQKSIKWHNHININAALIIVASATTFITQGSFPYNAQGWESNYTIYIVPIVYILFVILKSNINPQPTSEILRNFFPQFTDEHIKQPIRAQRVLFFLFGANTIFVRFEQVYSRNINPF